MEKIFNQIDTQADKYTGFLRDICSIETKSEDKPALDQLADFIEQFAKKDGFSVFFCYLSANRAFFDRVQRQISESCSYIAAFFNNVERC